MSVRIKIARPYELLFSMQLCNSTNCVVGFMLYSALDFADLPWEVNVQTGRWVKIYCRLVSRKVLGKDNNTFPVSSSNLRFKRLDRSDPYLDVSSPLVTRMDDNTILYRKPNASSDDDGPYACAVDVEGVKYPGCITTVRIRTKKTDKTMGKARASMRQ